MTIAAPMWDMDLGLGDPEVDADHRQLIELSHQYIRALDGDIAAGDIGSLLNLLLEYADSHFAREEDLMVAIDYPEFEAHARSHRGFIKNIVNLATAYDADASDAVKEKLKKFLSAWVIGHISRDDAKLYPYVQAAKRQGKEVEFA